MNEDEEINQVEHGRDGRMNKFTLKDRLIKRKLMSYVEISGKLFEVETDAVEAGTIFVLRNLGAGDFD